MPRRNQHAHRIPLVEFSQDLDQYVEGVGLVCIDVFGALLRPRHEDAAEKTRFETAFWSRVPGVTDLLEQLKQKDVTLVALSEPRVEATSLHRLLEGEDLIRFFDRIDSLSDDPEDGRSAKGLQAMLSDTPGSPDAILHIAGEFDTRGAAFFSSKIRTVALHQPRERKRRALLHRYAKLAKRNRYWRGRHLLQIAQGDSVDLSQSGFHYRYGREMLGPIFCTYILRLLERLDEIEPECVYFVARDGYLLQELYKQMTTPLGYKSRPHQYLHLSRRTAFAGSIRDGLTLEKAQRVLKGTEQPDLASVLQAFGLNPDPWQTEAQRHGWSDIHEPLNDLDDPRLASFLSDPAIQAQISVQSETACRTLEGFLEQEGFFDKKKIALVDIGWNGNSQRALSELSAWRASENQMFGLYFALVSDQSREFAERNQAEGLWYDYRDEPSSARIVTEYEEIFEEAARAAHATTVGYRENGSRIEPEFKAEDAPDRLQELACNSRIAELQRGILDFASDFSTAIQITGYTAHDIKPFIQSLAERAIAFPSRREVEELTSLAHAIDLGQNSLMDYSQLKGPRIRFPHPGRFMSELRASHWRYASLSGPLRVAYHLYRGITQR